MIIIVIGLSVPLTHNLPKTEAEKIEKYEKLAWNSKIFGRLTTCLLNRSSGYQNLPLISRE
jgi:hypothetical protein